MRAKLLPVHLWPHSPPSRLRRRGRTPRRARRRRSTRRPHPVAEVDLLVEHEEARVEAADLVERLDGARAALRRRGTRRRGASRGRSRAVERVQQRGCAARASGGTGTRSRGATSVGKPRTEGCSVPSGFSESRPDDAGRGSLSANATSRSTASCERPRVGVHQEQVAGRTRARSLRSARRRSPDCRRARPGAACGKRSRTSSCEPSVDTRVDDDHLVRRVRARSGNARDRRAYCAMTTMTDTSGDTSHSMSLGFAGLPRGGGRRVLVCTPFPPRLDARHGGKATAQLLLRLAERNEIGLLCLRTTHGPIASIRRSRTAARSCTRCRAAGAIGRSRVASPGASGSCAACRRGRSTAAAPQLRRGPRAPARRVAARRRRDPPAGDGAVRRRGRAARDPARSSWTTTPARPGPTSCARDERTAAPRAPARGGAWRRYERRTRPRFDAIVVFAERDLAAVRPSAGDTPVTRIPLAVDVPARPLAPVGVEPADDRLRRQLRRIRRTWTPPVWLAGSIFPRVATRCRRRASSSSATSRATRSWRSREARSPSTAPFPT